MKLNHDCVRDLMLEIEEIHIVDESIFLDEFLKFQTVQTYGFQETYYAVQKLREENLIIFHKRKDAQGTFLEFWLDGLTYNGHSYLDNIRSTSSWKSVKSTLTKFGTEVGLPIAVELASSLARKSVGLD